MTERIRELLERVGAEGTHTTEHERTLRESLPAERGLRSVEREIAAEIASSLGRAGSKLEAALESLRGSAVALAGATSGTAERRALLERYDADRAHAERRLRDLLIQREAIGLRNHADVHRRYVIPPRPSE
jgi:hypothetical protein